MKIEYPAIFDPADEGGYTITFPDFPEAISEGDTLEEANYNATEVLDLTIKSRMEKITSLFLFLTPDFGHFPLSRADPSLLLQKKSLRKT